MTTKKIVIVDTFSFYQCPYVCTYGKMKCEGRSFNSGTNAPPYHMSISAVKSRGVVLNDGTKFCLILFSLSKIIES